MKLRRLVSALCLGILVCGCAANKALPVDSREAPLFHDSTYTSLGLCMATWTGTGEFLELPKMSKTLLFQLEVPVNSWASFNGVPVNWNFLLTGRQYDDSGRLAEGKFHSVFSLGPTGIAYSSAEGWSMPAQAQLRMKRLLGERWFWTASLEYDALDALESTDGTGSVSMGGFYQTDWRVAIGLKTVGSRYLLRPSRLVEVAGASYLDGAHRLWTGFELEAYPTPHHVVGFTFGHASGKTYVGPRDQLVMSGSYRYVF